MRCAPHRVLNEQLVIDNRFINWYIAYNREQKEMCAKQQTIVHCTNQVIWEVPRMYVHHQREMTLHTTLFIYLYARHFYIRSIITLTCQPIDKTKKISGIKN